MFCFYLECQIIRAFVSISSMFRLSSHHRKYLCVFKIVPEATFYSGVPGQIRFNQGQSNEALQIAVHTIHRMFQQRNKNTLSILTHRRHTVNKFCQIAKNMNLLELPKRSRFSHRPLTYTDRTVLFFRCAGRDTSA